MADPWAEFRLPENNAAQLIQNDPTTAPPRAQVPSSQKVWGDAEAQKAGLYETTDADPWAAFRTKPQGSQPVVKPQGDRAPVRITIHPLTARFSDVPQVGGDALQQGLTKRGAELTRGEPTSPAANMAIDAGNQLSAASQGTTPHIDAYNGRLLSTEVFEDDGGNLLFRDPQTGNLTKTDNSKHVALRDPNDNTIKVFSRGDETNESPVVGVSRVLAPGLAAGAATARPAIAATNKVVPKASDIFSTAKAPYREFDVQAARAAPILADEAKIMVDRVQNALDTAHLPSEVAEQVHKTVALIGKKGDTALNQLQYVKRAVGKLFQSPDKNVRDGAAVATKEIVRMVGEASPTAGASLQKADAIHSTARSVQDLQRKADIANLRTGRAGYGGNAVNNMRTQIEKIVEASVNGRQTGFKPNEIQAMREIVDGNWVTNGFRKVGAMSPSKGIIQIGTGIATGGVTAAIGAAANKLATILTAKQLERLNELVAKRSPEYSKAVSKAVERFENAQLALVSDATPAKFAAYISASRALSSGLTRDGIQIASGDLIKLLAGPPKAAADSEQDQRPDVPGK